MLPPSQGGRPQNGGRIGENIMHFGRVLRAAGLPAGTGAVLDAIAAVTTVGLARRDDLYWTLYAVFVTRHEQVEIFDQAFHIFWRNPKFLERMTAMLLPQLQFDAPQEPPPPGAARVAEAFAKQAPLKPNSQAQEEIEIDARFSYSQEEVLRDKDFELMSGEEVAQAKAALRALTLPVAPITTRRFAPTTRGGRVDMARTLRATMRMGGAIIALRRRQRVQKPPPLVVICDISGSMSDYTRMFLHFVHGIMTQRQRVSVFVFGTRLSNITRQLRGRDVDAALDRVAKSVTDWSGGTRISRCLRDFNFHWSRRVLGQGAVVLLITDGLERDDDGRLSLEMQRLHRSTRRLVWLNPLLRYDKFTPRASGIKAMLPFVDEFRAVHSLASIADLVEALGRQPSAPRLTG
ncbi:MAG: vWA domain-containing protein [Alphaproteobacteria bacterium]